MGLPTLLTTDQGKEFRNQLDRKIMSLLGVKRHLVTPYHPQVMQSLSFSRLVVIFTFIQANGLDERWNQTMRRMLVKFTETRKDSWEEHLDSCVFAYNTSRQESTLYSPFEVMFGRLARLPVEVDTDNDDSSKRLETYIENKEVNCFRRMESGLFDLSTLL